MQELSKIHSTLDGRGYDAKVDAISAALGKIDGMAALDSLEKLGIGGMDTIVEAGFGMDTITQPVTTPSIPTPVQFLQNFLPGHVQVIVAAMKIDDIIGRQTVGEWFQEQIVQSVVENSGTAIPYGDQTNVPFVSFNQDFVTRTIVPFEMGMMVGRREEERNAATLINVSSMKRNGCAMNLNIQRNLLGFYGYNNGANLTYGFLNDSNLPAYLTVPATGTGSTTQWANKNFQGITGDLRGAIVQLRTQSQDTIDPRKVDLTLAVPTNCVDYLSDTTDFGVSVEDWLKEAYPRIRVVSAPELNNANGGANVFYLFAEKVNDGFSTDDSRTFAQVVPATFFTLGVQQLPKGYVEDYLMASAGVLCKRPYAVTRFTGI